MGNCFILLRPTIPKGHDHVLRVMKTDDKILEYRVPILVKDLLLNFDGYRIGVSRKSTQHLPLDYELRLGQMYYLLPSVDGDEQRSLPNDDVGSGGSKRIKVIITKQQLQELLSKKVSVEDVLSDLQRGALDSVDSMESWRPKLETIPEGKEYS